MADDVVPGRRMEPGRCYTSTEKCHADDFIFRSKGLECNGSLSVLHHEALFHLTGKVLNLADSITQESLTAWILAQGTQVLSQSSTI